MSELEDTFEAHCKIHLPAQPIREFPFALPRKFRFDFCWVEERIAVEIQGGTWAKGAHSSGKGLQRDFEKNNLAVLLGWRVYYFDTNAVTSGEAINFMKEKVFV